MKRSFGRRGWDVAALPMKSGAVTFWESATVSAEAFGMKEVVRCGVAGVESE